MHWPLYKADGLLTVKGLDYMELVVSTAIAVVMLVIQCGHYPSDARAGGLAYRVGIIGLVARFASLFLVTLASLNGSPPCSEPGPKGRDPEGTPPLG